MHQAKNTDQTTPPEVQSRPLVSRLGSSARPTLLALMPLIGLLVLIGYLVLGDAMRSISGGVPVESVAVESVELRPGEVALRIRNDGRVPVTVSQMMVDDAYQQFAVGDRDLNRLEATTVSLRYPWEEAVPLHLSVLSSTGTVFTHEVPSPANTPKADRQTFTTLTLIGLGMATIPVALGLLWLPALRRASPKTVAAALAFTLGLLAFLLVDTTVEGLELAASTGDGLNGPGVFAVGVLGALAVLAAVEPRRGLPDQSSSPDGARHVEAMRLAWLVSIGIGLHNLGEGLAVGTAMRVGELALGATLVVGFAVHNLTEGVAIASPLSTTDGRVRPRTLVLVAAAAGLPAVPGLWLGGLSAGGVWAVLGLGVAAGAIIQVLWSVGRFVTGCSAVSGRWTAISFTAALVVMYGTGLFA